MTAPSAATSRWWCVAGLVPVREGPAGGGKAAGCGKDHLHHVIGVVVAGDVDAVGNWRAPELVRAEGCDGFAELDIENDAGDVGRERRVAAMLPVLYMVVVVLYVPRAIRVA
jgi:hypothetical protein